MNFKNGEANLLANVICSLTFMVIEKERENILTMNFQIKRAAVNFILICYFTSIISCVVFLSFYNLHFKCVNLKYMVQL